MTLNLLDQIGNWNPQLFREIKGRLKMGNIAIATALSICGQLLLFLYFRAQIPVAPTAGEYTYSIYSRFCTEFDYNKFKCVRDALGNFDVTWQYWWLDLFVYLSIFSAIVLLVAGTYMLVSDLDKEERRGTLNFIRFSPQSAKSISIGKILGVPILLYLAAILAVPLHLYSGLAAQVPWHGILGFYIAIVASCGLFYSAAMLFGLTTSWLGGFQPWLASATVLFLITLAFNLPSQGHPAYWITFLSPVADLITFLSPAAVLKLSVIRVIGPIVENGYYKLGLAESFDKVQWFGLPVGTKLALATALNLSICATGIYWIWQGLQRRFPNPSATVLSKRQSYLLVACCQAIFLGFVLPLKSIDYANKFSCFLIFNWIVFLVLIAALTPDRQSLYDWARYRKQIVPSNRKLWRRYPLLDLIWSEKSPAVVAIALNSLIPLLILIPWLPQEQSLELVFIWVVLETNLIMIYATIAQLYQLAKNRHPAVLALTFAVSTIAFFGYFILLISSLQNTILHIFARQWTDLILNLLLIIGPWTVLVLLNLKLMRQLKIAGESASKALLKS